MLLTTKPLQPSLVHKIPKTAALIKEALNTCAGGKASSEEALPAWKAALALAPWAGNISYLMCNR